MKHESILIFFHLSNEKNILYTDTNHIKYTVKAPPTRTEEHRTENDAVTSNCFSLGNPIFVLIQGQLHPTTSPAVTLLYKRSQHMVLNLCHLTTWQWKSFTPRQLFMNEWQYNIHNEGTAYLNQSLSHKLLGFIETISYWKYLSGILFYAKLLYILQKRKKIIFEQQQQITHRGMLWSKLMHSREGI